MTERLVNWLALAGLAWCVPIVRLAAGQDAGQQLRALWLMVGVPVLAALLFLLAWDFSAARVRTSLGAIPGPAAVWQQARGLLDAHWAEREREAAFYQRQRERQQKLEAEDPGAQVKRLVYTGKPTYLDQILTSLCTVFAGFTLATLVAVPLGLLCGMSRTINTALNPLIQIFKPVSPLAWLPIVTLVVSAVYVRSPGAWIEKSFLTSAITVTLCSLWPTLINTAVGVSSVDKDLVNVSKVLRLGWRAQLLKLVLPSALPYMFTGMRLSLGVGWMVLIAAEMLAQNPGLGKFIWDEFQNGSEDSLGRIMVAVLTIGVIGFALDRLMLSLQQLFAFGRTP